MSKFKKATVYVCHPTTAETVKAEVSNDVMPGEIIDQLIEAGFLSHGPHYLLARQDDLDTPTPLDPKKNLPENGVMDGDTLAILLAFDNGGILE